MKFQLQLVYLISLALFCNLAQCQQNQQLNSMDLINNSQFIELDPGYSLLMNIDFTFYLKIDGSFKYGTDWSLSLCSFQSSAPSIIPSQTYCNLNVCSNNGTSLPLPKVYFDQGVFIYQEYKLRLYNQSPNSTYIFPYIACTNEQFVQQFPLQGNQRLPITYTKITSSRAQYGTSKLFFFVLNQNKLLNYLLPFNMPTDGPFFDQVNPEISFPSPPTYSSQPFDTTYWQNINTVLIPYIPFFSFCNGFGRHILLNEVFESIQYCNLIPPENTKTVNYIPTIGFDPVSDSCHAEIQCEYEEDFTQQYKGTQWYFPTSGAAIYLSTDPITIDNFIQNENDPSGIYQQYIINNDNSLIGVPITADNMGVQGSQHPSKVTFNINYNQVDRNTKRIISANIIVSDYVNNTVANGNTPAPPNTYTLIINFNPLSYVDLVNYFQFGQLVYAILFIILSLIPVLCVFLVWIFNNFISTNKYKPPLKVWKTIKIAFWPAFEGNVYGIIPSILVTAFVYILQNNGTLFSNSSIYYQYDFGTVSIEQAIQIKRGRTGLILSIVGLFFIYYGSCLLIPTPTKEQEETIKIFLKKQIQDKNNREFKDFNEFHTMKNSQDDEENDNNSENNSQNSQDDKEDNEGESLHNKKKSNHGDDKGSHSKKKSQNESHNPLNHKDEDQDNLLDGDNDKLEQQESNKNLSGEHGHGDEEEKEKEGEDSEEEEEEDFEITQVFIFKRYHFFVVCLISSVVFLALLEFSYTSSFTQYIDGYIFLLFLIEAIFITILQEFILKESLLVYPISASLETIQFIMTIAASNFIEFIKLYLIRMLAVIIYRSYLDPVIANKQIYKIKFIEKILSFQTTHKLLPRSYIQILQKHVKPNAFEQNLKNYMGIADQNQNLLSGSKTLEQVLNQLLTYASKMHSIFTKPCALFLILIFSQENMIPDQYSIRQQDFVNYLIFASIIIFPQIMIDVLVLNSLEVLYGIKLYDYFSYCKYKYDNRGVAWIGQNYVKDKTIDINFRSLDNMCFSVQFYFVGCITIAGIIFLVIGISVMIRQNYIFFSDPAIYAIFPFLYFVIMPSQRLLTWIWLKIDIWKLKVQDKTTQPLSSIEDVLNQERDSIEQIMEEDEIREHFLKCNKEWLIKNMKDFLTPESFLENNEYLLNEVYRQLLDDQKKEEKEIRRQQMQQIKKDQEEKKTTDITIKRNESNNENGTITANDKEDNTIYLYPGTKEHSVLVKIIQIWYYRAKQVCFLKNLVKSTKESKLQNKCQICDIDIELNVIELESFNQLIYQFKVRNAARPFNKYQWINFYEKNQRFQTMCIDCEYKRKKAFRKNINSKADNNNNNNNNNNNTIQKQYNSVEKNNLQRINDLTEEDIKVIRKILLFWYQQARANLIIKQLKE
ncbi:hypothetical protein ABPG74_005590 [Tetrahymena malaccensis]